MEGTTSSQEKEWAGEMPDRLDALQARLTQKGIAPMQEIIRPKGDTEPAPPSRVDSVTTPDAKIFVHGQERYRHTPAPELAPIARGAGDVLAEDALPRVHDVSQDNTQHGTVPPPAIDLRGTVDLNVESKGGSREALKSSFPIVQLRREREEAREELTKLLNAQRFDERTEGDQSAIKTAHEALYALDERLSDREKNTQEELAQAQEEYERLHEEDVYGEMALDPAYGEKLTKAQQRFENAWAAVAADDIVKKVHDDMDLVRFNVYEGPRKNAYGRIMQAYKWFADKNLARGREGGRLKKMALSMFSLRAGISGILGGLAFVPAVGAGALIARQALAGASAAYYTYERKRQAATNKVAETKGFENTEKKDISIDTLTPTEVAEKMQEIIAHAQMKGNWEGLEASYQKVRAVYEKQMAVAIALGQYLDESVRIDVVAEMHNIARQARKTEQSNADVRQSASIAAGVAGVFGFNAIRQAGVAHEFISKLKSLFGAPTAAAEAFVGPEGGAGVNPDALREQVSSVLKAREAIRPTYAYEFAPGEGPLHQARKAIAQMIGERADAGGENFSKGQRLWLERRLWELTEKELGPNNMTGEWHPGNHLAFNREAMERALGEMQDKFKTPESIKSLDKSLEPFTKKINWSRYEYKGYGAWQGDGGVRYGLEQSETYEPSTQILESSRSASPDVIPGGMAFTESLPLSQTISPDDTMGVHEISSAPPGGTQIVEPPPPPSMPEGYRGPIFSEHTALSPDAAADAVAQSPTTPAPMGLTARLEIMPMDELRRSEAIRFTFAQKLSGLAEGDYDLIAHGTKIIPPMRVLDLDNTGGFWSRRGWPEGVRFDNHRDIMRRLRFRDAILSKRHELLRKSPLEWAESGKLTVAEFYEKYFVTEKILAVAPAK